MEDIGEYMQSVISMIHELPDFMALMDNDTARVYEFEQSDPTNPDVSFAIQDMPQPGAMLQYTGTGIGFRGGYDAWEHRFSLHIKIPGAITSGYFRAFRALASGSTADGRRLMYDSPHASFDPVELPSMTGMIDRQGNVYYVFAFVAKQIGD